MIQCPALTIEQLNKLMLYRFEKRLPELRPADGCWLWQGTIAKSGHGVLWANRQMEYAHRVSYVFFVGPVPEGLVVRHAIHCTSPRCIAPHHLQLGTRLENMKDIRRKRKWDLIH